MLFFSAGFLRLVDVLVEMEPSERKAFLQFATGCSSLPPGGLANLHPRLTVVRKVFIHSSIMCFIHNLHWYINIILLIG